MNTFNDTPLGLDIFYDFFSLFNLLLDEFNLSFHGSYLHIGLPSQHG